MDEILGRVPSKLHARFREIVAVTDAFCDAHLNPEYRGICRNLAAAACSIGLPVTSGKAAGWAAGVVAAVGFANFLGDPSQPFHMTTEEMARNIGVSPATLHNKSKQIRNRLDIRRFDPRFSTTEMVERNPLTWMFTVNGLPMDIRRAPREVQEEAFRRGLIPRIPAGGIPTDTPDERPAVPKSPGPQ
jgi:Domain of unknown function (DUF6398)